LDIERRLQVIKGEDPIVRMDMLEILEAAVRSIDPYRCVKDSLSFEDGLLRVGDVKLDLGEVERILVVGTGKATVGMSRAVFDVLGDKIDEGYLNVLDDGNIGPINLHKATHPYPSEEGRQGAEKILALCEGAGENDLVIYLISGGGSAMMPLPPENVSVEDKSIASELLMLAGANIEELNTVRKHLSQVKGGNLVRACHPAMMLSLIISDVIGDPLESICSGPTASDPTTFSDALMILDKYGLREKVPQGVMDHLRRGEEETPKPGNAIFERVENVIVGNNRRALLAAKGRAIELGYKAIILTSALEGEAREVGKVLGSIGSEVYLRHDPIEPPAILLAGGETTVTVKGRGRGGRNCELVLGALPKLSKGVTLLSFGTDGVDGNSNAGGAIGDAASFRSDASEFLERNDSASYFEREDSLIVTGPTGTNVGDIVMMAVRRE
jgi:glycerate 2-kinase